ncbi:MAG: cytochrome c oxidase accessory protein CcoG [Planctomycetota bacterium]
MTTVHNPLEAKDPVLSTLNRDGTRRWIRPKTSPGRLHRRRTIVAWLLIAVFTTIPYLEMNGKPLILLDIVQRKFTLFGATFLPTDTRFLMLFMITILVGIFLITALVGRVWCGWACPQTVYMEFLFRPLEQWIEGGRGKQLVLDRQGPNWRRLLRYVVFVPICMFLAHTFLAYFVGVEQLLQWVQSSPTQHPWAFVVMAGVTAAMLFDFGFFREQTCLVACPYGRFQSALLDRCSLIVGYDFKRGEPRGKVRRGGGGEPAGDCIDCKACVTTCPTGIDIRNGLQMECIHCTQCIDACDQIMDRVGKPRGLIRYSSQAELAGERHRLLRPRVILYPLILLISGTLLVVLLASRSDTDVALLRARGALFQTIDATGEIANSLEVKLVNRSEVPREYLLEIVGEPRAKIVAPDNPIPVAAGQSVSVGIFVTGPAEMFTRGRKELHVRVSAAGGFSKDVECFLLGPYSK